MYVSTVLFKNIPPNDLQSCWCSSKVSVYGEEVQSSGSSLCKQRWTSFDETSLEKTKNETILKNLLIDQGLYQKCQTWAVRHKLRISEFWNRGVWGSALKPPMGFGAKSQKIFGYLTLIRLQNQLKTKFCNVNILSKQFPH